MKDNPLLTCKCGTRFRKYNWDKSKTYTMCWKCYISKPSKTVKEH